MMREMITKAWQDIDDVLFDGTKQEITAQRCPECGGILEYHFDTETMSSKVECTCCRSGQRGRGLFKLREKEYNKCLNTHKQLRINNAPALSFHAKAESAAEHNYSWHLH